MDLASIDKRLDVEETNGRVVIETPMGSLSNCSWNSSMEVSGLVAGGTISLYFGMVPAIPANDGDSLDILVVGDETAAADRIVDLCILGVKAEQTECSRTDQRIDRVAPSDGYAHGNPIDDIGPAFVDRLGRWFRNDTVLKGREGANLCADGPREAAALIAAPSGRQAQPWL
jgi:inorganic pyrophosphatase